MGDVDDVDVVVVVVVIVVVVVGGTKLHPLIFGVMKHLTIPYAMPEFNDLFSLQLTIRFCHDLGVGILFSLLGYVYVSWREHISHCIPIMVACIHIFAGESSHFYCWKTPFF